MSEIFFVDEERSFAWSENYLTYIGCDPTASNEEVLTCIRGLDLDGIMGPDMNTSWTGFTPLMFPSMPWSATVDGVLMKDTPYNLILAGYANKVPILAGTNKDEGSLFAPEMRGIIPTLSKPLAFGDADKLMNHFFGNNATVVSLVQSAYPDSSFGNATEQIATIIRDFFFLCPTSRALLAQGSWGEETWLYQFVYRGDWIEDSFMGDYHSAELEYVFGNAWPPIVHQFSARDQAVSTSFGYYWSNFIKYGNPNGNGATPATQPNWPPYDPDLNSIAMDVPPTPVQGLIEKTCEMWDHIAQWAPPLPTRRESHRIELA